MRSCDAKTRYALLAVLDLAQHSTMDKPAKIREVAARTAIPPKYLVHILLRLKRQALVNSSRGAKGGYWLLRPAHLITAADVVAAVGPGGGRPFRRSLQVPHDRVINKLWEGAERSCREFLGRTTLAELLQP